MSIDLRDVRISGFRTPEQRGGRYVAIHVLTGARVEWDDTQETSQGAIALREAKLRELEKLAAALKDAPQ